MPELHGPEFSRAIPPEFAFNPAFTANRAAAGAYILPHTVLFREGERVRGAYRLTEGCIVLAQLLADGRRQIVDVLGPGRLFGMALTPVHLHTAETLSYCLVERVGDPADLGKELDANLHLMLRRSQAHATLLGRKTAGERVASAVLDLAAQFARPSRGRRPAKLTFNLHLTRADLADWLGLTVETVSRYLNRFKRTGLIDFRHPEIITILDRPSLMSAAGLVSLVPAEGAGFHSATA